MSKYLRDFFDLATDESDDFSHLVRKYGIDPEIDFRSSDFTGVDFGALRAPRIDLTNCTLTDADLSKIRCNTLVVRKAKLEGARLPRNATIERDPPSRESRVLHLDYLKTAALTVFRYEKSSANLDLLLSEIHYAKYPLGISFQTEAEQNFYTKKIVGWLSNPVNAPRQIQTEELVNPELVIPRRVVWFYTNKNNYRDLADWSPQKHDRRFIDVFTNTPANSDAGLLDSNDNPFIAANRRRIENIRRKIRNANDLTQARRTFVTTLTENMQMRTVYSNFPRIILFSGYPPISNLFGEMLNVETQLNIRLIFIAPKQFEIGLNQLDEAHRPEFLPRRWVSSDLPIKRTDIDTIARRIAVSTHNIVTVGKDTRYELSKLINQPISKLKSRLINKIYAAARTNPSRRIVL